MRSGVPALHSLTRGRTKSGQKADKKRTKSGQKADKKRNKKNSKKHLRGLAVIAAIFLRWQIEANNHYFARGKFP